MTNKQKITHVYKQPQEPEQIPTPKKLRRSGETEKQKGKRPASENENLTQYTTPDEKRYKKGKRSGSIFRAERVNTIHEMTIEEARNTEVSITGTARGRYGNAHIRYDINDGLVDVILEVIPTEEQNPRGPETKKKRRTSAK
jgi:hypothetical protein